MSVMVRNRKIFWVVAVVLIGLGALTVWLTQTDPPEHWQKQIAINGQKQIAINIAWEELLQHFPDGKSFDSTYAVYDVRPLPDKGPNIWQVTYDLPYGPTESMIWITVDIEKGKVLLFDQAAA